MDKIPEWGSREERRRSTRGQRSSLRR